MDAADADKPLCKKPTMRLTSGDECEECPLYQRGQDNFKHCAADKCKPREIVLENGKCRECGPYTVPTVKDTKDVKTNCDAPAACKGKERMIITPEGECTVCADFTRA